MHKVLWIIISIAIIVFLWRFEGMPTEQRNNAPSLDLASAMDTSAEQKIKQDFADLLTLSDWLKIKAEQEAVITGRDPRAEAKLSRETKAGFRKFAKLAREAAARIDANNGPNDLACIFRGMAEDADRQLTAMKSANTQAEQSRIWSEAVYLFADVRAVLFPINPQPQINLPYAGEICSAEPL